MSQKMRKEPDTKNDKWLPANALKEYLNDHKYTAEVSRVMWFLSKPQVYHTVTDQFPNACSFFIKKI